MEKLYRKGRRFGALLIALAVLLGLFPAGYAADDESAPTASVTFTFTDSGVTASDESASGYEIDGTFLTVTAAGTYAVTGACSEGNITVKKGVTGVVLVLDDLTLACSSSAPLLCKKSTGVTLWLNGASVLTDNENPDDENSEDETVADAFEGAAV